LLYGSAEAWRKQDLHLLQWQAHERRRALNRRKEIYRKFAADLSREYSLLLVEKFDLRRKVRRPTPEEPAESAAQRKNRFSAAISRLRLLVTQLNRVEVVSAVNATRTCHHCGSLEQFDASAHLDHTCSSCGSRWDQDANNCMNRLHWHRRLSE